MKLPFCKYFSKNFITIIPTIKLAKIPKKNGTLNTKSFNLNNAAAAITVVKEIGLGADVIAELLKTFKNAKRRFAITEVNDTIIIQHKFRFVKCFFINLQKILTIIHKYLYNRDINTCRKWFFWK